MYSTFTVKNKVLFYLFIQIDHKDHVNEKKNKI